MQIFRFSYGGTPKSFISRWDFSGYDIHLGVAPFVETPFVGYGRKMGVTATYIYIIYTYIYIYIYIYTYIQIHMGFSGIEVSGL
jgi:hypothetical protein